MGRHPPPPPSSTLPDKAAKSRPTYASGAALTVTWEEVETVLDQLAPPERRDWAALWCQAFRLSRRHLSPMDALQEIVLTGISLSQPTRTDRRRARFSPRSETCRRRPLPVRDPVKPP